MSADTVAPIIDRIECSCIIDRIYGASSYNGSKLLDIELATISFCARLSCWVGSARGDLLTSLHATSQAAVKDEPRTDDRKLHPAPGHDNSGGRMQDLTDTT